MVELIEFKNMIGFELIPCTNQNKNPKIERLAISPSYYVKNMI